MVLLTQNLHICQKVHIMEGIGDVTSWNQSTIWDNKQKMQSKS
jgi:hypothetical protein